MPETITRACGHTTEFTPKGDQYDEARREKCRRKRCPECGKAKNEADNAAQKENPQRAGSGRIKKGQEVKHLPVETVLMLWRKADGSWEGKLLTAEDPAVTADANGLMSVVQKLARAWLKSQGAKLQGKS
jgi:hypothetical protein